MRGGWHLRRQPSGQGASRGPGQAFVNTCFTNDLDKVEPGQAQYTLCCNHHGGVVDDVMQYLVSDDEVFLVPNATNNIDIVELLAARAPSGIIDHQRAPRACDHRRAGAEV